jgi:hypothetical protein
MIWLLSFPWCCLCNDVKFPHVQNMIRRIYIYIYIYIFIYIYIYNPYIYIYIYVYRRANALPAIAARIIIMKTKEFQLTKIEIYGFDCNHRRFRTCEIALDGATGVLIIMKCSGCSHRRFWNHKTGLAAATAVLENVKWFWLQPQMF